MLGSRLLYLQIICLTISWTVADDNYVIRIKLPTSTTTSPTTTTTTTTTTPAPRPIFILPPGYTHFWDIQTSYKISSYATSWMNAQLACASEGARLAVIDTWPKLNHVASMRSLFNWVWTGIYFDSSVGSWRGVHGGLLINGLPWAPFSGLFGNCVAVSGLMNGLNRWPCNLIKLFVCEVPDAI